MQVRLSRFNLLYWQQYGRFHDSVPGKKIAKPGITVCMPNNSAVLGTIQSVGPTKRWMSQNIVEEVEVLWHSGSKKGKKETRKADGLVNYSAYKGQIQVHLDKMHEAEVKAGLAK